MKLMSIAGARPNFMKLAALASAIASHNLAHPDSQIQHVIVHTGQHYDEKMSAGFFNDLGIPKPDINLEVGSGSHAVQTAEIMKRFEPVLLAEQPDVLLVVGDVNSTIACALVAAKSIYPADSPRKRPFIVHVEAGLRSFDRGMPEEINRILTDAISDMLFVTEKSGVINLQKEGVAEEKIFHVGNVMIDTLHRHLAQAAKSPVKEKFGIVLPFALVTLHRPSNVDSLESLQPLVDCLVHIARLIRIIFPLHPRTRNNLQKFGLLSALEENENISIIEPLGYLDFLHLIRDAEVVITDSGGIQEETTFLQVPCVTLRENTERPVTVSEGSNYLVGTAPDRIKSTVESILAGKKKEGSIPLYWDGKAGQRIIAALVQQVSRI